MRARIEHGMTGRGPNEDNYGENLFSLSLFFNPKKIKKSKKLQIKKIKKISNLLDRFDHKFIAMVRCIAGNQNMADCL